MLEYKLRFFMWTYLVAARYLDHLIRLLALFRQGHAGGRDGGGRRRVGRGGEGGRGGWGGVRVRGCGVGYKGEAPAKLAYTRHVGSWRFRLRSGTATLEVPRAHMSPMSREYSYCALDSTVRIVRLLSQSIISSLRRGAVVHGLGLYYNVSYSTSAAWCTCRRVIEWMYITESVSPELIRAQFNKRTRRWGVCRD